MPDNRVALVTGAARGQGLSVVHHLLDEGLAVVAGDVLLDELHQAVGDLGPRVLAVELDVADEKSWSSALEQAEQHFGGLNVLVNNAGVLGRSPISDETQTEFERQWRVNCLGLFLGMQTALPWLRRAADAAVVNTLSNAAIRPFGGHASYVSSKSAARGLTQTAAIEFAEFGIRVNAVLPGPVATPMHSAETIERLAAAPLLGRAGTADDIASVVAFLASPRSSFMTGAEVVVDGGHALRIAH